MSKFDNAYFEFKIEPEDSKLLINWNELRSSDEFKDKMRKLKELNKDNDELEAFPLSAEALNGERQLEVTLSKRDIK